MSAPHAPYGNKDIEDFLEKDPTLHQWLAFLILISEKMGDDYADILAALERRWPTEAELRANCAECLRDLPASWPP